MKKVKFLLFSLVFFLAAGSASLSFGAGRPLFIMIWDEIDTYYVLVKFDQNQFSQNDAESLSQFLVSLSTMLPADDLGMNYAVLSPNEMVGHGLGDADVVKWTLGELGWDHIFIDLTQKAAPVARITNYNMDIYYSDAYLKQDDYLMSVGIPSYLLALF